MPYKLYIDKNENFTCEVAVKNASLKGSIARLVVESNDGINFIFNGKIDGNKCNIPIKRLKGLLDENAKGNISLEVIVEDTYFKPWNSDFIVEEHTSIKVKIDEQAQSSKPSIKVTVPNSSNNINNDNDKRTSIYEVIKLCEMFNIKKSTISYKQNDLRQLINEYFNANPEYKKYKSTILNGLKSFLK